MKATIWHGSTNIVEVPQYSDIRQGKDFGPGFYCTQHQDLAGEWACSTVSTNGYANKYELDIDGLAIFNLCTKKHNILNWIALIMKHRNFNPSTNAAKNNHTYLLENFLPRLGDCDVVIGYRADDSYFSIVKAFMNDRISLEQLKTLISECDPGKQIVLKSPRAISAVSCIDCKPANGSEYYVKRKNRDEQVHMKLLRELAKGRTDDLYMSDIMNGGIKNDDPRLQ